jgi:hypothetical protein
MNKNYQYKASIVKISILVLFLLPGFVHAKETETLALENRAKIVNFVGNRVRETRYQSIVFRSIPQYFSPSKYSLNRLGNGLSRSFQKLPSIAHLDILPVYGYAFNALHYTKASAQEVVR